MRWLLKHLASQCIGQLDTHLIDESQHCNTENRQWRREGGPSERKYLLWLIKLYSHRGIALIVCFKLFLKVIWAADDLLPHFCNYVVDSHDLCFVVLRTTIIS